MRKINYLFTLAFILGISITAIAQDTDNDQHTVTISVPDIALLDLESSGSLNFNLMLSDPGEAGTTVANDTNNTTWINYTSVVGSGLSRTVTARAQSAIPAGYILSVEAATDAAGGNGTVGTPGSVITLSTTDQTVISGIGSSYTGDGASNGHQLTYVLQPDNAAFGSLVHSVNNNVVVVYTISDDL